MEAQPRKSERCAILGVHPSPKKHSSKMVFWNCFFGGLWHPSANNRSYRKSYFLHLILYISGQYLRALPWWSENICWVSIYTDQFFTILFNYQLFTTCLITKAPSSMAKRANFRNNFPMQNPQFFVTFRLWDLYSYGFNQKDARLFPPRYIWSTQLKTI